MIKCKDCGGTLKPKIKFFNQSDPNGFSKLAESFKKEFGKELKVLKGYNCIKCGSCYDLNFKRQKFNILWMKK